MNIAKSFERFARRFLRYGCPEDGGRWWAHWQNLSRDEGAGDLPLHGRAWLNWGDWHEGLRVCWNLVSSFAHVGFSVDGSDGAEICFKAALPPAAVWISLESWPILRDLVERVGDREIRFVVHDGALWWSIWMNPDEWREGEPFWRRGSLHPVDLLLGEKRAKREKIDERNVFVAFVEGSYPVKARLERVTVRRSRWPFAERYTLGVVEADRGVPIPGKGENSWDCGDDAVYSSSDEARSIADAVGKFVASIVETRLRRGGPNWRPERPFSVGEVARA